MAVPSAHIESATAPGLRGPRQQGLPLTLVALFLISLFGTAISVSVVFVPGALVAAFFAVIFYLLLVAVRVRDRRAWARATAGGVEAAQTPRPESHEDQEEIAPDVPQEVIVAERASLRTGLIIVTPLGAMAVVLAAVFLGWKAIGLGALFFFAIMIFMGAPIWLAAVEDEIDEEEEKIGAETRSIR